MERIKLALLYGGDSTEREVSIMSWEAVRENLDPSRYEIFDYDLKTDLPQLVSDAALLDVALICMHGRGGEDGAVQGLLDLLKLPYQGSGVLGSATAMNKRLSKELYLRAGLTLPKSIVLNRASPIELEAFRDLIPCMVKPAHEGSSGGMSKVEQLESLPEAIADAFKYDEEILVEEFIAGIEVTGAVIGLDELQSLPLIEIVPKGEHIFFDYTAKYDASQTDEICPARISPELTEKAQKAAITAHRALGLRGYSRTDMIIRNGEILVLETNTIPGMTKNSLLPKAASQAGIEFSCLLDLLIEMAFQAHKKHDTFQPDRASSPISATI